MNIFDVLLDNFKLESTRSIEEYNQGLSNGDIIPNGKTIYFNNGKMYKVYPTDENGWYDAKYLVSDGNLYDLESLSDLNRIPIPHFDSSDLMDGYGITGSLEYVLKMKAANLREKGMINESDIIYSRLHLFMGASDNGYSEKDFLVYCHILLKERQFEKSESEKQKIKNYLKTLKVFNNTFDFYDPKKQLMDKIISDCKQYNTDYVMMSAHCSCCEECNKLQGRIYSISGKSNIFPQLPKNILKTGLVHVGCRHSFTPYFFNKDDENMLYDKMGNSVDAIQASQRPFVDDRTESEKVNYFDYLKEQDERKKKENDEIEYCNLLNIFPESAPKSFGAYRRMKNARTKNFLKLSEMAKEKGIKLELD